MGQAARQWKLKSMVGVVVERPSVKRERQMTVTSLRERAGRERR